MKFITITFCLLALVGCSGLYYQQLRNVCPFLEAKNQNSCSVMSVLCGIYFYFVEHHDALASRETLLKKEDEQTRTLCEVFSPLCSPDKNPKNWSPFQQTIYEKKYIKKNEDYPSIPKQKSTLLTLFVNFVINQLSLFYEILNNNKLIANASILGRNIGIFFNFKTPVRVIKDCKKMFCVLGIQFDNEKGHYLYCLNRVISGNVNVPMNEAQEKDYEEIKRIVEGYNIKKKKKKELSNSISANDNILPPIQNESNRAQKKHTRIDNYVFQDIQNQCILILNDNKEILFSSCKYHQITQMQIQVIADNSEKNERGIRSYSQGPNLGKKMKNYPRNMFNHLKPKSQTKYSMQSFLLSHKKSEGPIKLYANKDKQEDVKDNKDSDKIQYSSKIKKRINYFRSKVNLQNTNKKNNRGGLFGENSLLNKQEQNKSIKRREKKDKEKTLIDNKDDTNKEDTDEKEEKKNDNKDDINKEDDKREEKKNDNKDEENKEDKDEKEEKNTETNDDDNINKKKENNNEEKGEKDKDEKKEKSKEDDDKDNNEDNQDDNKQNENTKADNKDDKIIENAENKEKDKEDEKDEDKKNEDNENDKDKEKKVKRKKRKKIKKKVIKKISITAKDKD